jgi:heavy metal sensor kinase
VRSPFRSVRVRLTLWYVLLLAAVLALFSAGLYTALSLALYGSLDNLLRSSAALLSGALETDAQGHLVLGPGSAYLPNDPKSGEHFWRVIAPSGEVIGGSGVAEMGSPPVDPAAIEAALAGRETIRNLSAAGEVVRVFTGPLVRQGQVAAVVQLGFSTGDIRDILNALRWILIAAVPAVLGLASLGGLFLAGRALQPVDRITRAAQSISAHDLSRRLELDLPPDELGRLAGAFNDMIARLDEAFRQQRRFTADASHELRTPLTVIKGDLSLALNRPRTAAYYRRVLAEVDQEVDRMRRLVDRLLALARTDMQAVALDRQWLDLSALLAGLAEQIRPLVEAKGLGLALEVAPGLHLEGDPDVLAEALLNLLDNAIRYTPEGGIGLRAHYAEGSQIQVAVSDSGPGIPAEHLAHIFDRFYRVDRARSRDSGGAGLGLSIARELIRAHDGEITVDSVPGGGTVFTVLLPVKATTQGSIPGGH